MYERATGRHRAPRRPTTPLTPLTTAVGERVNQINPAGLVVAMSSGLLATGGIPMTAADAPQTSAQATRVAEAVPHPAVAFRESVLTSGAPFSAPDADTTLAFDRASFTAVPKPPPPPAADLVAPSTTTRTSTVSRSTQRTAVSARATTTTAARAKATHKTVSTKPITSKVGSGVLAIAGRYVGVRYVYGGTTPRGFDCSGYVQYVFRQVGVKLPRTADQQMRAGRRIPRSQARPGDLVAFVSGGSAYHIGIYAGGNQMYDAPRPGKSISKRAIWSATVVFVRV